MTSTRTVDAEVSLANAMSGFTDGVDALGRRDSDGWILLTKGDKSVWAKEWSSDKQTVHTLAERFPGLGTGSQFTTSIDAMSHIGDWSLLVKGNKSVWAKEWSTDARPIESLARRFPSIANSGSQA